jgi:hypothetical protein
MSRGWFLPQSGEEGDHGKKRSRKTRGKVRFRPSNDGFLPPTSKGIMTCDFYMVKRSEYLGKWDNYAMKLFHCNYDT